MPKLHVNTRQTIEFEVSPDECKEMIAEGISDLPENIVMYTVELKMQTGLDWDDKVRIELDTYFVSKDDSDVPVMSLCLGDYDRTYLKEALTRFTNVL